MDTVWNFNAQDTQKRRNNQGFSYDGNKKAQHLLRNIWFLVK